MTAEYFCGYALFSIVDVVGVLTDQPDIRHAAKYWRVLKTRLKKEGSELTTKCSQLKMLSADGKRYKTDVATTEQLLRIIQSIPYANRNGMTILLSYIDRAFSAITSDRPEFQNIIWDSEKGLFDIVLVWKIDRFSRDRYGSAHYKHLLKKNGVKVVQLNRIFLMGRNRS